jgi:hypothetical protein
VKRVHVVLGHRQAAALLEAASRGIDEWEAELDDLSGSVHGPASERRKALEAWRALYTAMIQSEP